MDIFGRIFEAKIECMVNRPFRHRGIDYEQGDIFLVNPNDRLHKRYLRSGKIFELPENEYEYIYVKKIEKLFYDKVYKYGDIVNMDNVDIEKRRLFVRRGYLKKIIKSDTEVDFNYLEYAKQKGISFKDLKTEYKERFDVYLPHHLTKVNKNILANMEKIFANATPETTKLTEE